jgi:hypothetical protein
MREDDYTRRVVVKNMTDIKTYFRSRAPGGSMYDVDVEPSGGEITLTAEEVYQQCRSGNRLFTGYSSDKNKLGHHASLYICDEEMRHELGFESDTYKQEILDEDKIIEFFSNPRISEVKRAMPYMFITMSDRWLLRKTIDKGLIIRADSVKAAMDFLTGGTSPIA